MTSLSWGYRADVEQLKFELLDIEPNPVIIGRFVIAKKLGAGATGVVLEAYDPQLERGVAIKVLRAELAEESELQARLQREARALARLSHPNVVAVFEVGEHEQHAFVVMELVRGPTLREWLAERPRPWREILDVFLAAGRGLSAAHASDLVHRDFKPENLLLTADGVPKVVDFGLVSPQSAGTSSSDSEERLTDQPVGTPRYMAPEQLSDEPVDARADQYSFCVALHEALAEHTDANAPPRRMLEAIERGRSTDAADRWPTLESLLVALRSTAGRQGRVRRQRWGLALGAGVAAVAALAVGMRHDGDPKTCGDPALLQAVWSPTHAEVMRQRSFGPHTAARLDRYATRWQQATEQACRTRVEHGPDRRLTCLQHRLLTLDTFVQSIPDSGSLPVVSLPPPEACLEPDGSPEPSEAVAEALARAHGTYLAGDYAGTGERLRTALASATAAKDDPGTSDVHYALGHLAEVEGRYEEAIENYEKGFFLGFAARRQGAIIRSVTGAMRTESQYLGNMERAELWAEFGRRLADEGSSDESARLGFLVTAAAMKIMQGKLDEGVALATSGLSDALKLPDEGASIVLLATRATARERKLDFDGAVEDLREAILRSKRSYGETHTTTAELYANLGSALRQRGDLSEARAVLESALDIYRTRFGSEHADTGLARLNLSAVYAQEGNFKAAAELLDDLPQLFDRTLGPEHAWTSVALRNTCFVARELGRSREVVADCRRAVAISAQANGPDHFETAESMMALADVLQELGDTEEVEQLLRKSIEAYEPDFPLYAADNRQALAEVLHATGRDDEAIGQLRLITALRDGDGDEDGDGELRAVLDTAHEMLRELEGGA